MKEDARDPPFQLLLKGLGEASVLTSAATMGWGWLHDHSASRNTKNHIEKVFAEAPEYFLSGEKKCKCETLSIRNL